MASPTTAKSEAETASSLRGATGWFVALIPGALFVYFLTQLGTVAAGQPTTLVLEWVPSLDINLIFRMDGLGLLFALIISGVGTFIMIYAGGYLADDPYLGRFYLYIVSFMFAMLGVVLSDNLLALFVFWELTSLTSFLLIGYKHAYKDSREAAKMALLVTGSGGLALLAGLVMLGLAADSWYLSEIFAAQTSLVDHPLYIPILVLVLIGAFTKSAQFPFHFWLPGAMAAPTPVSAYLHSATMVKAGVYLLARLNPTLGGSEAWFYSLGGFGAVTMFFGAYIAWQQTDLKRILAFSTVSALGTLVMLIGLGTETAIKGAMVFLLVHSLYKGTLFMVAGAIDHETGTRNIGQLGGLRQVMPITCGAAILAVLSMSGIPPFYGFVGKEVIYEATLHLSTGAAIFTTVAVVGNALTILAGGLLILIPFFGQPKETPKHPHEAPLTMWLGPVVLGSLGLILGLLIPITKETFALLPFAPELVAKQIVSPAVGSILNEGIPELSLSLWHGINTPLMLSIVTVALGVGGYFVRKPMFGVTHTLDQALQTVSPERIYHQLVDAVLAFATWQTNVLQNGYLRVYLMTVVVTTALFVGVSMSRWIELTELAQIPDARLYEYLLAALIIGNTYVAVRAQTRLTAVLTLGAVGISIGLVFVLYGAPDLAMTQLSIETLMSILLVLVLYRLPRYFSSTDLSARLRDAIFAGTTGLLITLLVLAVTSLDTTSQLTPFFAEVSYTEAQGRNVVNVILVDFRGMDTMGEITVLAIAALGVYALMRLRLGEEQKPNLPSEVIDFATRDKTQ